MGWRGVWRLLESAERGQARTCGEGGEQRPCTVAGAGLYLAAALAVLELWLTLLLGAAGILAAAERPLDGCAGMSRGSCWQLQVYARTQRQPHSMVIRIDHFDLTRVSYYGIEYHGLQMPLQL